MRKLGVRSVQMDGVKLAPCRAQAAADALFLIDDSPAAAQAAGSFKLDLLLAKTDAVIVHSLGLALVIFVELPFGNMALFLGYDDIALVESLEIAQVACDSEAVSGMYEAVDADRTLTAVGDRIDGILRAGCDIAARRRYPHRRSAM